LEAARLRGGPHPHGGRTHARCCRHPAHAGPLPAGVAL